MGNSNSTSLVKPIVALTVSCALVGVLLGSTNEVTTPIIAANREAKALETYASLVPEAEAFVDQPTSVEGVTAFVEAEGTGDYVIIAQSKGYSGEVPVAIAIGSDSRIIDISIQPHTETPGLGNLIEDPEFTDQFIGLAANDFNSQEIDAISGATISSDAATASVQKALAAYEESILNTKKLKEESHGE